jgi:hypothetical protein
MRTLFFLIRDENLGRKVSNTLMVLSKVNSSKDYFVMRLPFENGKIIIYSKYT